MDMIAVEVGLALEKAGFRAPKVTSVLSPAWTTDWITQEGRTKLERFGIAPPNRKTGRRALFGQERVKCPRCGAADTSRISEFGSTPCRRSTAAAPAPSRSIISSASSRCRSPSIG